MELKKHQNVSLLESEIFNGLVGYALLVNGIFTMLDFFLVANLTLKFLDILQLSILLIGYLLSKSGMYTRIILPFCLGLFFTISIFSFYLGGFRGTIFYYYVVFCFCFSILLKPSPRNVMLLLSGSLIVCMIYLQLSMPEMFVNVYEEHQDLNLIITFLLALSFIVFGAITIKRHYDTANTLISSQNHELNLKNAEIRKKNLDLQKYAAEIELMNHKLNEMVIERTEKIKSQNDKLIEYAFFNAHKVRGPLARVMGLVDLLQNTTSEEEKSLYLEKLKDSANELDEVVGEINKILVDNNP